MTEKPALLNAIYTNSAFFPMHQESEMASRKSSGSAKPLFAQVPPLPFTLHKWYPRQGGEGEDSDWRLV